MATYDLFSKRRKRELGETPDVFSYSNIPQKLRVQIINIWWDALGNPSETEFGAFQLDKMYKGIVGVLRREYGVFSLVQDFCVSSYQELTNFFWKETKINHLLDVVEITAKMIDCGTRDFQYRSRPDYDAIANEAIADLNLRMKEHGVGYYYSDGVMLRVDAEVIHKEAVIPALTVLRTKGYESAQSEFLSAHEHHRAGRNAEALVDCCKAFESVLKIICTKRGWPFDPNATASKLVDACLANGLVPQYWQSHFAGLRSVLGSAIPTPRNRQGGHGAGASQATEPPEELIAYVLHMTAATILFLSEAERKMAYTRGTFNIGADGKLPILDYPNSPGDCGSMRRTWAKSWMVRGN